MSKNRAKKTGFRVTTAAGAVMAVSMIGLLGMTDAAAGTPGTTEEVVLQVEKIAPVMNKAEQPDPVLHILEETASDPVTQIEITPGQQATTRDYKDVPFVLLPVPMDRADQEAVYRICQDGNVAFPLVMALIEHESEFDASARSTTGDSGLMQINDINKDTLFDMGYQDLFLLEDNVGAGVYMLSDLFNKYPGDTTFVLMAYNAGEKGAKEQRAAGIYETEYSREILQRASDFSTYIDDALNN